MGALAESHAGRVADASGDDAFQALERAAAHEQDVARIHLDIFLVRVFAPALGRDVDLGALDDLEQRLLHAFARDIARDGGVVGLAGDLVDLVNEDDAGLGAWDVEVGGLQQAQQDVFHVLAHVAGFGEGRGIGNAEGHVEDAGQGAGDLALAHAGRSQQQDVALVQFELVVRRAGRHALVVVVDGNRDDLFGAVLANHVVAEQLKQPFRRWDASRHRVWTGCARLLLINDVAAQVHALVADVDAGRA